MQPFQAFDVIRTWKNCSDRRPWLIVELRATGVFGCFPISSAAYSDHEHCFLLESSHPDFAATGLAKNCYVHASHIIEVRMEDFRRHRGELLGELLRDFRDFAGV